MKRRAFLGLGGSAILAAAAGPAVLAQPVKAKRIYGITWRGATQVEQGFMDQLRALGLLQQRSDIDNVVIDGAAKCLRPMLMTVGTTVLGLTPLLLESGVGADLSARTAAPVVGGLWACMFLTLLVLPAAYTIWRRWQLPLTPADRVTAHEHL